MGELDEVAAGADGAMLGNDRGDAVVDEGGEVSEEVFRDAGMALHQRVEAARHGGEHEMRVDRLAGADRMAAHEIVLQFDQLVAADDVRGHRAEAGGHAIDDMLAELRFQERVAGVHRLQRLRRKLDLDLRIVDEGVDVSGGKAAAVEDERLLGARTLRGLGGRRGLSQGSMHGAATSDHRAGKADRNKRRTGRRRSVYRAAS